MIVRYLHTILICVILLFPWSLSSQVSNQIGWFDQYFSDIPAIPDSLINATSRLIESLESKEDQSTVARLLFIRFAGTSVMGYENVAVYIAENYFLNKRLEWDDPAEKDLLQLYVDFHKNSLIGKTAPELTLTKLEGNELSLHSIKSRYILIYFFDHNCSACREGLPELKKIIDQYSHLSICVYAVYTQSNRDNFESFILRESDSGSSDNFENWHFVYDPENKSDFLRQYGVFSTPSMLLIDSQKEIIGRKLNNNTLKELLASREDMLSSTYTRAEAFVPEYLSLFDFSKQQEIDDALVPLSKRVIEENIEMYNALFFHIFEYLAASPEQFNKEAALYTADMFILPNRELWFDEWFINSRVPQIKEKIINNREGAVAQNIILTNSRGKDIKLHKIKGKYIYLYFFSPDCPICTPFNYELKKIHRSLRRKRVKVISVYTGDDLTQLKEYLKNQSIPWPVYYYSSKNPIPLHKLFETEFIPQTYLLDKNKIIVRKGINTIKLNEFINNDIR